MTLKISVQIEFQGQCSHVLGVKSTLEYFRNKESDNLTQLFNQVITNLSCFYSHFNTGKIR